MLMHANYRYFNRGIYRGSRPGLFKYMVSHGEANTLQKGSRHHLSLVNTLKQGQIQEF